MRRLYFLLPDIDTTRAVVSELAAEGIGKQHMHVLGNHFHSLEGLPEANVLQKSELLRGMEWGALVGGLAGLIGGGLVMLSHPGELQLGYGALAGTVVVGAAAGAPVSSLIAKDIPNQELAGYRKAIAQGHFLAIVDVARERVEQVAEAIRSHHPEVDVSVTLPKKKLKVKG